MEVRHYYLYLIFQNGINIYFEKSLCGKIPFEKNHLFYKFGDYLDCYHTSNFTNMSDMFNQCSSLSSLPDISEWDTYNVTEMKYLFYKYSSLSYLTDIS